MFRKYFQVIFTTLILWCGALELRLQAIPEPQPVQTISTDEIDAIAQEADTLSEQFTEEFANEILFDVEDGLLEQNANKERLRNLPILTIGDKRLHVNIGLYNRDIDDLTPLLACYLVDYAIYKNWYLQLNKEIIRCLISNQDIILELSQQLLSTENEDVSDEVKFKTKKNAYKQIKAFLHNHISSKKMRMITGFSCASLLENYLFSFTNFSYGPNASNVIDQLMNLEGGQSENNGPQPINIHIGISTLLSQIPLPIPLSCKASGESRLLSMSKFFMPLPDWATNWKTLLLKDIISQAKIYNDNIHELIDSLAHEISEKHYPEIEQLINAEQNCTLVDEKVIIQKEIKAFYSRISSRSFYYWLKTRSSKQVKINAFFYFAILSPQIIDLAKRILSP